MPPWLHEILFSGPKHVWKTLERVLIAMFTTRATVPLGLMVVLYKVIDKLESRDLQALLQCVVDANWFSLMGWSMFVIAVIVGILGFRWRERIYQLELNRMQETKNQVLAGQLEIKFPKHFSPK